MRHLALLSSALCLMLAGCAGGFEVQQTEPFRVQLEGAPEQVTVRESDDEPQRVVVETCPQTQADCVVDEVDVEVVVTTIDPASATSVLVTVQSEDGGEVLAEVVVDVPDQAMDDAPGNASDSNTTEPSPTTAQTSSSATAGNASSAPVVVNATTVIQNIVVQVKGKDNLVVLTQALSGDAEVQVAARAASQMPDIPTPTPTSTTTPTANQTTSSPTTSNGTNTTSPP